jgi:hypothetical protein
MIFFPVGEKMPEYGERVLVLTTMRPTLNFARLVQNPERWIDDHCMPITGVIGWNVVTVE